MIHLRLKSLRIKKKMTQADVANALKINRGTYANYERGHREPDIETLKMFAEFYDVSIDYLVGNSSETDKQMLTPYQQEVIDFFNSREDLFFHDHPGDIKDALEQFEIYYEIWKKQQQNKNK